MNDSPQESNAVPVIKQTKFAAFVLGILLILAALIPWQADATQSLWSQEDSQAFAKISAEYHRLSYQTPQQSGLSQEEIHQQTRRAKAQYEAFEAKLKSARHRPRTWKRYLLWTGILMFVGGGLAHLASDRK